MAVLSKADLRIRFGLDPAPVVEEGGRGKKAARAAVELIETNASPEELEALLQPASLDLVMHCSYIRTVDNRGANMGGALVMNTIPPLDLSSVADRDRMFSPVLGETWEPIHLAPGQRVLTRSKHWFKIPSDLGVKVYTRSTVKRLGIDMVGSAGWIDPGYQGYITLEPVNENNVAVLLPTGVPVAQLVFETLTSPAPVYSGSYTTDDIPGGPEAIRATMIPRPLR